LLRILKRRFWLPEYLVREEHFEAIYYHYLLNEAPPSSEEEEGSSSDEDECPYRPIDSVSDISKVRRSLAPQEIKKRKLWQRQRQLAFDEKKRKAQMIDQDAMDKKREYMSHLRASVKSFNNHQEYRSLVPHTFSETRQCAPQARLVNENQVNMFTYEEGMLRLVGGMPMRKKKRMTLKHLKKQHRKRRGPKAVAPVTQHSAMTVPKVMFPSETDVWLNEVIDYTLVNVGSGGAAAHYYCNSGYHSAPSVLADRPGYNGYSNSYNYVRLLEEKRNLQYYNMDAFPKELVTIYSNTDPTASYAAYYNSRANVLATSTLIAAAGGGQSKITTIRKMKFAEVVGTKNVETDDTFRSVVTADPVDFIWFGHAAINPSTMVDVNGVFVRMKTSVLCRFYGRFQQDEFMSEERRTFIQKLEKQQCEPPDLKDLSNEDVQRISEQLKKLLFPTEKNG
jgi:hypothetical protein